jgi:hypothetical protein
MKITTDGIDVDYHDKLGCDRAPRKNEDSRVAILLC